MKLLRKSTVFLWGNIHILPRFVIRKLQSKQLVDLVLDAYNNIPFYREVWTRSGIAPNSIRGVNDINLLPIISKALFRQYPLEYAINKSYSRDSYRLADTSGSTGEPFRFARNIEDSYWEDLINFRSLIWSGIPLSDIRNRMKIAEIRVYRRPRGKDYLHIPIASFRDNQQNILKQITVFRPHILHGRPSVLVELARFAEQTKYESRPDPVAIISEGETLHGFQRKYIEEIFRTNLYDRYGLEEIRYIAANCEKRYGLHIYEESAIVEILDDDGNVLPDGMQGRIIVTSLRNKVMPFIRYETGDKGVILTDPCPCGIMSKRLLVFGRTGGFITIKEKKFNQIEFEIFLSQFSHLILRFQIAKIGGEKLEIRIIPTRGFFSEKSDSILSAFKEQFGFEPEIKIVESIPLTERGKTVLLVNESRTDIV